MTHESIASKLRVCAGGKRVLLATAAPREAAAVCEAFDRVFDGREWVLSELDSNFDLVVTGVGKAAAAGAVARTLDDARHGAVINCGIAGGLAPSASIGRVIVAEHCEFTDEGVATPSGYRSMSELGFGAFRGHRDGALTDPKLLTILNKSGFDCLSGTILTVSTCAGNDDLSAQRAATGALAEAMEGAAVALVAQRLGIPMVELRVISNTTGNRERQQWDLPGSLAVLTKVLGHLRR